MSYERFALGLMGLLFIPTPSAYGAAGVIEINQACVAVGCFSGDAPGFPITITQKGAYRLTSDVVVTSATTTAIALNSDDISLDLNGFAVRGPNRCPGTSVICSDNSLTGTGIDGGSRVNVSVRGGAVRGFGFAGINLGQQARIEDTLVEHNTRVGVWVRKGSSATGVSANFNGYLGFETDQARLINCAAADNGQVGMAVGAGSLIDGAVVVRTAQQVGILDWYGSRIINSSISANPVGVESINGGTSIVDTVVFENVGVGVSARGASGLFPPAGLPVSVRGSTLVANNGGGNAPQWSGSGSILNLGTNVCGTDTVCP